MHFNYFLPDRRTANLNDLVQCGLGYVFQPESAATAAIAATVRPVYNGPGGQNGVIVSTSDQWIGYYQGQQEWRQEPGKSHWVGLWTADRPTPDSLARQNQVSGTTLLLDDGQSWLIPKARHFEEFDGEIGFGINLPTRLTRDELGNWVRGEIKQRYRRLWDLATELVGAVAGDQTTFASIDELAVEAFTCNYRVSATELDLLGIYDVAVRDRVIRIVIDLDGWAEIVKKKRTRQDSGNSNSGPGELTPDQDTATTDQQ
jgi:hypothetical protein